jgi:hypothetical protein
MDATIDQPPRHDAEALRIKISQVDDIHEFNLPWRGDEMGTQSRIAQSALTPYFKGQGPP